MNDSKSRKILIALLFGFLAVIVFGLIWFFVGGGAEAPVGFGWYLFSFAAGLSMIVLPCTLPLAFVIVPLSMGKGPAKGFLIAIAFGLGVAVTLSMYGVLAAVLGKFFIEGAGASLETVKNWLYFIAGLLAYLFALGELGLINFRMPSYSGAFPAFIQKQQDVLKALLLGLFLGNIGVGCPHPATPVIFTRIAVSGDVFYGWLLFFVHAIGRILPLLFLAILGILGVNALKALVAHKEKISRATGWGMVFVAAFILVLGLFTHDWWVLSGQHTLLEEITQEERFLGIISERLGVAPPHTHGLERLMGHTGLLGLPLEWGTWILLFLWIAPFLWYYAKKKKEISGMAESPEKSSGQKILPYLAWNFITLSILLIAVFGYLLPQRFLHQAAVHAAGENRMDGSMNLGHREGITMDERSGGHESLYREEEEVKEGIVVNLGVLPENVEIRKPATLQFFVNVKPEEIPISAADLDIQHEKRMHVIGVRRDLNEFFHIHPVSLPPDFAVFSELHTFQKPGDYKIWSEIAYRGEDYTFGHPIVPVAGTGPTFELQKEITTSRIVDRYQVKIDYHDGLFAGEENHIDFTVQSLTGNGVPLDNYLGEKMHLSVISEDLMQFIHTHPSGDAGAVDKHRSSLIPKVLAHGGEEGMPADHIGFTIPFAKPGFYKVFAQFKPQDVNLPPDVPLTVEFWIEAQTARLKTPTGGAGFDPWWRNLIVSVILIAGLSWVTKKFITVP